MYTRLLGGLALVLTGSALTLMATPHLSSAGELPEGLARAVAEQGALCHLPPGHPPVDTCLPMARPPAGEGDLPPGHPPVQRLLPPGHPPIDGMPRHAMPLPLAPERPGSDGFPQGYLTTT